MTITHPIQGFGSICDCDEKLRPEVGYISSLVFHKLNSPWKCVIPAQRRWPLLFWFSESAAQMFRKGSRNTRLAKF
jgi:hypothetical protein